MVVSRIGRKGAEALGDGATALGNSIIESTHDSSWDSAKNRTPPSGSSRTHGALAGEKVATTACSEETVLAV